MICQTHFHLSTVSKRIMVFSVETIEYEAQLKHQNEMKKLEAELKGRYVIIIIVRH